MKFNKSGQLPFHFPFPSVILIQASIYELLKGDVLWIK